MSADRKFSIENEWLHLIAESGLSLDDRCEAMREIVHTVWLGPVASRNELLAMIMAG